MAWTTPRTWTNHEFVTAAMMNTLSANFDETETAKVLAAGWTFYASAANTIVGLAPGDAGDALVVNSGANGAAWSGRLPLQRPITNSGAGSVTLGWSSIVYNTIVTTGGRVLVVGAAMVDSQANSQGQTTLNFQLERAPGALQAGTSLVQDTGVYSAVQNQPTVTIPWPVFYVDTPEAGSYQYRINSINLTNVTILTASGHLMLMEF